MKYGRGRIVTLTLLSITMALALFCTGYVVNLTNFSTRAADTDVVANDSSSIPTFDDLYQRIPLKQTDTGSVKLGQNTTLTLIEERYDRTVLSSFLNANIRGSYSDLQKRRNNGYPYPVFTSSEMQKIVNGGGNTLDIPVVMLDPQNYDDIVLFELTGLVDVPTELVITRDGIAPSIIAVDDQFSADKVYTGVPSYKLLGETQYVYDTEGNHVLSVRFEPNTDVSDGYVVEVKDTSDKYLYSINPSTSQPEEVKTISNGTIELCNSAGVWLYSVTRNGNQVTVEKADNTSPDTFIFNEIENQNVSYSIGAVAYNGNALRGMFKDPGFYEISFKQKISNGDSVLTQLDIAFDFVIVNKAQYINFPRFNTENRTTGSEEIYNYAYESEYPVVEYSSSRFDVQIHTSAEYDAGDEVNEQRELCFYNIGEYRMISSLQYYNSYLAKREQSFINRGVNEGIVKLNRYTSYSSVLNIFGFQAYYGGQHANPKYNGPLPFFDSEYTEVGSDISALVREQGKTASAFGFESKKMNASESQSYTVQLAEYLTAQGIKPVRTNFPPVKIVGNVIHATGAGVNGEAAVVLSSVAYKAAYGSVSAGQWKSSLLEVGAPFENPGQYLITTFFKVNNEICQQNFFFEIVNSANITFDVADAEGNTETYYAGELDLNSELQGNKVQISYDGNTTLGKFEVPPTITLESANFGSYSYSDVGIPTKDGGAFEFNLEPGQYRMTVAYGAHGKSESVFDIIVDNTLATGIKVQTTGKMLSGVPGNVAITGVGEASLIWDKKKSGIGFNNVFCEFYEIKLNSDQDPNSDRNYGEFNINKVKNLFSAYSFVDIASVVNHGYEPIETVNGWTLKESFKDPGLYIFTLIDDVGNETEYVLIIDNSTPTFVQSGEKSNIVTNAVNFDVNGIALGFGTSKLISVPQVILNQLSEDLQESLRNAGIMVDEERTSSSGTPEEETSLNIGLSKIEYSKSGNTYKSVLESDIKNGYMVLNEEDTFYFRVTDILGNIGEYYIILTHDKSFGRVYAETTRPTISTLNDHLGRGIVTDDATVNTSIVTATGGMTNRSYVTFSFQQRNNSEPCFVKEIYLKYYPMTYDINSKNYPFAEKPEYNPKDANGNEIFANQYNDGVIYTYNIVDKDQEIRLALFNTNSNTPSGMYILTRSYGRSDGSELDKPERDYYFIVDNQKMLHYAEGSYQTALKVRFANSANSANEASAKVANASTICKNNNELSSDRTAWVYGFNSKYSWKHDSIVYSFDRDPDEVKYIAGFINNPSLKSYSFTFPSLTPKFSYVYNHQTVQLGEGSGIWSVGDPANVSDNSTYKLLITDDARNISCMINDGNITELKDPNAPTSANYDYLILNLEIGRGANAEIQISDDQVFNSSRMHYDGESYHYVVDPAEIDELKFSFVSDPESMYTNIDVEATTNSWQSTGFMEQVALAVPTAVDNKYTFDLTRDFLAGKAIKDGASLSVSLVAEDGTITKYTILFDTNKPNYNLGRIKDNDNLARTLKASDLPANYVYGLGRDFVFEKSSSNPYFDVKTITYREVDYAGDGTQSEVAFNLYTGATGEIPVPFAEIVGLRDNEMKYYWITETDYAGHSIDYRVQIQGDKYVNNVKFIGAITNDSADVQVGCEMHASKSSVSQFFLNNNSFKFENGDDYYMVLGQYATWNIGGKTGSEIKNEESLINTLNNWINEATEQGVKCTYTLYDRIGEVEVFDFYNIRETAAKIELDCYQSNASSSVIMAMVKNYDELPKILFDKELSSYFKMTVKDNVTGDEVPEFYFSLQGTPIQGFDVSHELIITVTDPFGRVSMTEYHQQRSSTINFTVHGNTVTQDGVLYVGDERGVNFTYLRTAYNVLIYDAGTGEPLNNLKPFEGSDNMISYTFIPKQGASTIEQYRIVATGRASGTVLFDRTFVFDTRLPSVEWTNASGQALEVEGQTFVSDVYFNIGNSLVTTNFPVVISYKRTFDNNVERVTLNQGTQSFVFSKVGKYEVTLRNTVWAEKTYNFEIAQIDDTLVMVYDDGKQIQASPSNYGYENDAGEFAYIPHYIFTTSADDSVITEYQKHGLEIVVGQTNRVLAGNLELSTDYYYYDRQNNTLVWRLAFKMGTVNGVDVYGNPIYFATTGVAKGKLNTENNVPGQAPFGLQLNGNPVNNNIPGVYPVLTSTNYVIYDSYMRAHDEKLEVKLTTSSSILRDADGMPCYMKAGNVVVVDCYYNGQLVKTLYGDDEDQVFTIKRYDAGFYEFVVHDMVGNYLYFGNSDDKESINYKQERFMLAVITNPMVLINDKQPINGMIYNDKVELKLIDYGNQFLTKLYAVQIAQDKAYLSKYFCISQIKGTYTSSNGKEEINITNTNGKSLFTWNKSGDYEIEVTYRVSENIIDDLKTTYRFKIIPAHTVREAFSMTVSNDVQLVAVKRNGYKIHDFDNLGTDKVMSFSADYNPGSYVVTLKTYSEILQQYVTHDVQFNIGHKANSASNYFILSSGSGSATTGAVTLYYNPYWLYHSQGTVTIYLYKNFVEQEKVVVDMSTLNDSNLNSRELFTVSDAGSYSVVVRDVDGDPVYMDNWKIKAEESTFGYIILAVVLGVAGISILVFLRLRNKMTTK